MPKAAPPEAGHGVAIIIGTPKGGDMPRRGMKAPPPGEESKQEGKVSPEEAMVRRDEERCIDCKWYLPDMGECEKVAGSLAPQDTCGKYFDPVEDDEKAEGEPPEGGADEAAEQR